MDDTESCEVKSWGAAVEGLKSESREQRRSTLKDLDVQLKATPDERLTDAFDVLHPTLVACVADETEKCRELAISLLGSLLERLPPSDYYLTYVVPAIRKRITSTNSEPSEEIRLALVQLLHSIIKSYGNSTNLVPFFDDFVEIIVKTSSDDCPTVKQETCFVVMSLANSSPKDFHMRSETLCKSILTIFQQRPFKVRVAAIQCIGTIVQHGAVTCFDQAILPMVLKLFDECTFVRLQVVKEVGNWMLNYPERYSYWHYVIPIILSSMCDYSPEIQTEATTVWDKVGLQYVTENEEELRDKIDCPTETPIHYPSMPRPNLGCRTLIIKNMGKIIHGISIELSNWQEGVQLRSAQTLSWIILHAEEKNVIHGSDILNCLVQGAENSSPAVVAEILKAAEIYGHFVGPHVWWILLGLDLDTWKCLSILAGIVRGCHIDQLKNGYLRKIIKTLSQSQYTNIQKPKYQINMLNVCEAIMNVGGLYCQSVSQEMFNIIFIIYSIPTTSDIEHHALCLIEKLRETIKFGSNIEELYCLYIRQLLANIISAVCFWTLTTPDRCILNTILIHTGPAIGLHLHLISPLLSEALSTQGIDPKVKLELFTTLCSVLLRRDEHFKLSEPEKLDAFLSIILRDIIIPNLNWSVGQTAEALRTAAVCCLCAILQDNESVSKVDGDVEFDKCIQRVELFPDTESFKNDLELLLPMLVSLINDRSKNTCLYSLRAIRCLVLLAKKKNCFSIDHLHTTYSPIIARLDDSNDKVRLFAVETLCTLFMARPESYDAEVHNAHIEALYSAMLLHLDDPDPNFQDFVLDALKKLCDVHPKMLKGKVTANSKVFRNTKALEHLDKHFETLSI